MIRVVPRRAWAGDASDMATFCQRIEGAKTLRHPAILQLVDGGVDEDRAYVVYRPDFGIGLVHLLKHHVPMPISLLARFAVQILDALSYLRASDAPPRSVAPERFLATYDGRLLWVDCGLEEWGLRAPPSTIPETPAEAEKSTAQSLGQLLNQLLVVSEQVEPVEDTNVYRGIQVLLGAGNRAIEEAQGLFSSAVKASPEPDELDRRYLVHRCRRQYSLLCSVLSQQERSLAGPLEQGEGRVAGSSTSHRVRGYLLHRRLGTERALPLWEAEGPHGPVWLRCPADSPPEPHDGHRRRLQREEAFARALPPADVFPELQEAELDAWPPSLAYRYDRSAPWVARREHEELEDMAATAFWVASGLERLHAAGLLYGNVHPRGVLLRPHGPPLLFDLGRLHRAGETPPELTVDLLSVAPETLEHGVYHQASERFAFGVLLYQRLCGTRPFRGWDANELSAQFHHRQPAPPSRHRPELGHEWDRVILSLLDPIPTARPSWAEVYGMLSPSTTDLSAAAWEPVTQPLPDSDA